MTFGDAAIARKPPSCNSPLLAEPIYLLTALASNWLPSAANDPAYLSSLHSLSL